MITIFVVFVDIPGRIMIILKMIVEIISFSIGSLYGLSISLLILTLIDRKVQKLRKYSNE
jgi:hypothetical protein